ncbi:hypothetical protein, partial [Dialister invisus]|uniref:hypothetical protein n=1 Tax=Dialister invisus TaxID=218538 RepID=UPI003C6FE5A1
MKKTNIFQVTIIAVLAALFGSGGGIAWGQTYLNGAADVNNYFGAGESATITGGNITWPQTTPPPSTPVPLANAGNRIIIGGTDPSANNSVIRVYNGKGYGVGWISVLRIPASNHSCSDPFWASFNPDGNYPYGGTLHNLSVLFYNSPKETTTDFFQRKASEPGGAYGKCPPTGSANQGTSAKFQQPIIYSFNSFNKNEFTQSTSWDVPGTVPSYASGRIAPCGLNLFNSDVTLSTDPNKPYGSARIKVGHHNGAMYETDVDAISFPIAAYTSTTDATFHHQPQSSTNIQLYDKVFNSDGGTKLTQFKGNPMTDSKALKDQKTPKSEADKSSNDDTSTDWYIDNYQRPTTIALNSTTLDLITFNTVSWYYVVNTIKETEQNYAAHGGRTTQGCNSGRMFAYAFDVNWVASAPLIGATKLDAAVQLINGAQVCVNTNVEDATTHIGDLASVDNNGSTPHQQTNALIVWPVADRATLRTKGNFQANMHHERTLATNDNVKYTAAQFPDPDDDIYMYPKAS